MVVTGLKRVHEIFTSGTETTQCFRIQSCYKENELHPHMVMLIVIIGS